MAFNRIVAKQFLKDYKNHLTSEAKTANGKVKNALSSLATYAGYVDSNENRDQCQKLEKKIDNIKTTDAVVELILQLGRDAHTNQSNTINSYSTYSETLHGLRSSLIHPPKDTKEYSPVFQDLPNKILAKSQEITKLLKAKEDENLRNMLSGQQVDPTKCDEYQRDLYYLGVRTHLKDPRDIKRIFPNTHYRWQPLPGSKEVLNPCFPLIIQEKFAEMQIKRFRPTLEDNILDEFARSALSLDDETLTTPEEKSAKQALDTIKLLNSKIIQIEHCNFHQYINKDPSTLSNDDLFIAADNLIKYDFKYDDTQIKMFIKQAGDDWNSMLSSKLKKSLEAYKAAKVPIESIYHRILEAKDSRLKPKVTSPRRKDEIAHLQSALSSPRFNTQDSKNSPKSHILSSFSPLFPLTTIATSPEPASDDDKPIPTPIAIHPTQKQEVPRPRSRSK